MTVQRWWLMAVIVAMSSMLVACGGCADESEEAKPVSMCPPCGRTVPTEGEIAATLKAWRPAAICVITQSVVEGRGTTPWSDVQRSAWLDACGRIMVGPSEVAEARPEPAVTPCRGLEVLKARRDAMANQTLPDDQWVEFGKTLSLCSPDQEPWTTLKLPGGRAQFMEWYAIPYANNDVRSGNRFQTRAARSYSQFVRQWINGS